MEKPLTKWIPHILAVSAYELPIESSESSKKCSGGGSEREVNCSPFLQCNDLDQIKSTRLQAFNVFQT